MSRTHAFGSDPGDVGNQGVIVQPPIPGLNPLDRIARSLESIEGKYVGSDDFNPQTYTLAIGESRTIDLSQQPCNGWVICVFQGVLNLWLGSFSGVNAGLPHFQYPAGQGPVYLPCPPAGRIFTFAPDVAGGVAFSFTPCYV